MNTEIDISNVILMFEREARVLELLISEKYFQ